MALVGATVDAGAWREPVAAALSRALGREVRLEGPARLTISLRPELVASGIRIANPPGFGAPDFARVEELRASARLLPLLRSEFRLNELRGRGVALRLERAGDGRGNWSFERAAGPATAEGPAPAMRLDIRRLALEDVVVEYVDRQVTRRLELADLAAEALPGETVQLVANGRADGPMAFTVRATAGPRSGLGADAPWPFDVLASLPGSALRARGTVSGPLDGAAVQAAIGAGTASLRGLANPFSIEVPESAAAIVGELEMRSGGVSLRSLSGVFGPAAFSGEVVLDMKGARPKLAGRVAVSEFGPSASPASAARTGDGDTLVAVFRRLRETPLDLRRLASVDADLEFRVAHWAGIPGGVNDLGVGLRLAAGRLNAQLEATVAGARLAGEIVADGATAPPRLQLRLTANDQPLGGLAGLLFDAPHVAGTARRFEAAFDARGDSPDALARDFAGRIAIQGARLTYGNYAGGTPVPMAFDAAEVEQPRGRAIVGRLHGNLRGKAFDATFRAGTVERILREARTPFTFDGTSRGARARLSGTLAEPSDGAGPDIDFEVTAPRAAELAPWLGFSSQSDARVALKGRLAIRPQRTSLRGGSLLVGRSSVVGDVIWQTDAAKPLVKADLVAERFSPGEIGTVAGPRAGRQRATVLEIPILPESLDFADLDLEARIKRVDGLPLAIEDVAFSGRMRDGVITPSAFSLRVEQSALAGALALDARTDSPTASIWLAGEAFDAGAVLRRLRIMWNGWAELNGVAQ